MFRVIILHEPVVGKFFSNERNERGLQDVAEQISIHDAIKDTNLCGTVSANSCRDMNLQRMFWFSLRWLVYLPVTGAPILHEGNEHSSLKMMLSKVLPLSMMRRVYSNLFTLLASRIS